MLEVAQWCENKLGRRALLDCVCRATDTAGVEPTEVHQRLVRLGLDAWITTNYDDLLEKALDRAGVSCAKVVRDQHLPYTHPGAVTVLKLHGDRQQPETIVLTQRDYEAFFRRYELLRTHLRALLTHKTFLFLGYRVSDPDFNQIRTEIGDALREHGRRAYAVLFEGDEWALETLRGRNIEPLVVEAEGPDGYNERLGEWLDRLIGQVERVSGKRLQPARPTVRTATVTATEVPHRTPAHPALPPNPFTDLLAVRDPARFVGREAELRRLQALLQGGSVALLGEPKVGKSSLLYHLARNWTATAVEPIDCQGLQDRDDLYACIAEALSLDDHRWRTVRQAIQENPVLLLLDELDAGRECGLACADLARLRAVAGQNPEFRLVAASRTPLREVFPDPGRGSPAYNFLQPLTLGPLAEREAYALLAHPWAPGAPLFEDETCARLVELARCHPFRLQRAAFHHYEALADPGYGWQAAYQREMEQML